MQDSWYTNARQRQCNLAIAISNLILGIVLLSCVAIETHLAAASCVMAIANILYPVAYLYIAARTFTKLTSIQCTSASSSSTMKLSSEKYQNTAKFLLQYEWQFRTQMCTYSKAQHMSSMHSIHLGFGKLFTGSIHCYRSVISLYSGSPSCIFAEALSPRNARPNFISKTLCQ